MTWAASELLLPFVEGLTYLIWSLCFEAPRQGIFDGLG